VPREDELQFQRWATQLATALEPNERTNEENRKRTQIAFDEISAYMQALIGCKRADPQEDLLSGLAKYPDPEDGPINDYDLISTAVLLLVAGHETTVNPITNGMLTLLRHPQHLERLRSASAMAPSLVEELCGTNRLSITPRASRSPTSRSVG
jgi:cytochrome P450